MAAAARSAMVWAQLRSSLGVWGDLAIVDFVLVLGGMLVLGGRALSLAVHVIVCVFFCGVGVVLNPFAAERSRVCD
jgi:hypothetical protein